MKQLFLTVSFLIITFIAAAASAQPDFRPSIPPTASTSARPPLPCLPPHDVSSKPPPVPIPEDCLFGWLAAEGTGDKPSRCITAEEWHNLNDGELSEEPPSSSTTEVWLFILTVSLLASLATSGALLHRRFKALETTMNRMSQLLMKQERRPRKPPSDSQDDNT